MNTTPKGFFVTAAPSEIAVPAVGARVTVRARRCVMDWPYDGTEGEVLGYSKPHGFAVLAVESGEELLVHPESLEVM